MNSSKKFSFLNGYSFLFEDGRNIIEAWFSSLSGTEKIFFNGELILEGRNLSRSSSCEFEKSGEKYRISIEMVSALKGPFICALYKNETLHQQKQLVFRNQGPQKPFYSKFWFYILVGLVLGVLQALVGMPFWVVILIVLALAICNITVGKKYDSYIEDLYDKKT